VNPISIAHADFNTDGKIDLVTANYYGDSNISVLLNCTPLSIEQFSPDKNFSVYPNPSSNLINIESSYGIFSCKLTDVLGNEMKNIPIKTYSQKTLVDVSDLNEGIYFITIKTSQNSSTQKIIVQR